MKNFQGLKKNKQADDDATAAGTNSHCQLPGICHVLTCHSILTQEEQKNREDAFTY